MSSEEPEGADRRTRVAMLRMSAQGDQVSATSGANEAGAPGAAVAETGREQEEFDGETEVLEEARERG